MAEIRKKITLELDEAEFEKARESLEKVGIIRKDVEEE